MLAKVVLILDKRRELSIRYKKLIESFGASVFISSTLQDSVNIISEYDPDLILISDSLEETLSEICKKLRMISYSSRPVIVALSKSDNLDDKLSVLNAGADDYLDEPIEGEEFKARINAHLRRHFENAVNEITRLADSKFSFRVLKRTILENKNWAALLIKINEFDSYREIYGELASDKMRQTFAAVINSTLDEGDFFGELIEGEFLVITNSIKAEPVASFITFAIDSIVEKFYSQSDNKQGYIILQGDDNAGKRIPLASVSIGIISNELKNYPDLKTALASLIAVCRLAGVKQGSGYMVEHPKISAIDSVTQKSYNNRVMVVETDDALNLLLKTTAQMQGYEVFTVDNFECIQENVSEFSPAVLVLDAGTVEGLEGLEVCKKLKNDEKFADIKIILSTVIHDKKLVLDAGADLYLPKPYEIVNIFNWVEKLLKDYNSF